MNGKLVSESLVTRAKEYVSHLNDMRPGDTASGKLIEELCQRIVELEDEIADYESGPESLLDRAQLHVDSLRDIRLLFIKHARAGKVIANTIQIRRALTDSAQLIDELCDELEESGVIDDEIR